LTNITFGDNWFENRTNDSHPIENQLGILIVFEGLGQFYETTIIWFLGFQGNN
jgi:hypothetical protein